MAKKRKSHVVVILDAEGIHHSVFEGADSKAMAAAMVDEVVHKCEAQQRHVVAFVVPATYMKASALDGPTE